MAVDLPYSGSVAADTDAFRVDNTLQGGQSDNDVSRVSAIAATAWAVHGIHGAHHAPGGDAGGRTPDTFVGVWGESDEGVGVFGASATTDGVQGISRRNGVHGVSDGPADSGVWGEHRAGGFGVSGSTSAGGDKAGVWGHNAGSGYGVKATSVQGTGVYAESLSGGTAGYFKGNVIVTGDLLLPNADLAEEFELAHDHDVEAGSVLVFDERERLRPCDAEYDRCVAGVASGAGRYKPAIVLHNDGTRRSGRVSIALVGRVYCKVDTSYGAIAVGDLLVTSATRGHAMKATEPAKAFGATIGKALQRLDGGQRGLIPILVALQ
jgi:hypothetical protein